jgi:LysM repeat protein
MPRKSRTHVHAWIHSWRPRILCLVAALACAWVPAAVAQKQMPETHTVRAGDTLWDIAKQYLNDPFLWPEVYRLNTMVVEDPHWIYPGEVLRLAPSENVSAVPETVPAAPAPAEPSQQGIREAPAPTQVVTEPAPVAPSPFAAADTELSDTTHLFPPSRGRAMGETLSLADAQALKPLRRGEFYSSGFLTEGDRLPFGRVLGPVIPSQIRATLGGTAPTLYSKIALEPPTGASYQVGDTLLLAAVTKPVPSYGDVVEPTGMARVTEMSQGYPIATVIAVYATISRGQVALPAEHFTDAGLVHPVAVSKGVEARVIAWPGREELKGGAEVLFLDKGKRDGVAPGDVFEVRRTPGKQPDGSVTIADVMATVQVVRVRERSATTLIVGVASPDIERGTHAVQVAKLPS